jgi:hypothetical protein
MLKKLLLHKNLGGANIFFEGMIVYITTRSKINI